MIQRQHPFGSPEKDNKKTLYKLQDPMLNFWYSVYSSHRSQWMELSKREKMKLLYNFSSMVFEDEVRKLLGGTRYWEEKMEFDCIQSLNKNTIIIFEVKFSKLKSKERKSIENTLLRKTIDFKLKQYWKISATKAFDWNDFSKMCNK